MFRFLVTHIRRRKAKRIANRIATIINASSGLPFFLKDDAYQSIPADAFVRAYLYGAISCGMRIVDLKGKLETKGWVIWETFDRLFPGKSDDLVSWCNKKGGSEDKEFKRLLAIGFGEMNHVLEALVESNPANVKTLETLRAHLVKM